MLVAVWVSVVGGAHLHGFYLPAECICLAGFFCGALFVGCNYVPCGRIGVIMLVAALVCGIVAVALMSLSLYFRLMARIRRLESDMAWAVEDLDFAFRVLADVDVIVGKRSVLDSERTADVKSWVSSAVSTLEHADELLREQLK